MIVHELKTDSIQFCRTWQDQKPWEFRVNDRDFQVGDILISKEHCGGAYNGRDILCEIVYMLEGTEHGIPEGCCIMTIDVLKKVG